MIKLRLLDDYEMPRILEILQQEGVAEALSWPRSALTLGNLPGYLFSGSQGNISRAFGVETSRGLVGCVTLNDMNMIDRRGTSSVAIVDRNIPNPALVMRDAISGVIDLAFNHFNLWRLESRVLETNEPIQRVYALLGIVKEGVMRQTIYRDGKFHNLIIYSVLRPEWEGRHGIG